MKFRDLEREPFLEGGRRNLVRWMNGICQCVISP